MPVVRRFLVRSELINVIWFLYLNVYFKALRTIFKKDCVVQDKVFYILFSQRPLILDGIGAQ